ncbi:hypothetical protein GQ42DRAFT_110573, partial [Ramicandelaber brevisporus]
TAQAAAPTNTPAVAQLRRLLGAQTRVATPDGRVFTGTFVCIDRGKNIILQSATEQRPDPAGNSSSEDSG